VTTTVLRTVYPVNSFDPEVSGAPIITLAGVAVDDTKVAAVQSAATANGVTLRVGGSTGPTDPISVSPTTISYAGPPIGGTFYKGELVVDVNNALWIANGGGPGIFTAFSGGSGSGFPLRQSSEQMVGLAVEGGLAKVSATAPAGAKPIVLAEEWGRPGVLRKLWYAANGGNTATPTLSATVTNVGTPGSTSYFYRITAVAGTGESAASVERSTTTGNATLSSSNYNTITWTAVSGATNYNIYRSSTTNTEKYIGTVGAVTTFNDQNPAAGTVAYPTAAVPSLTQFPEGGGIVRIYLDDPVNPVATLSMNDLFMSAPRSAPFDGRRVKRTSLSTQFSSGERYLFASWQRYMRVEAEHGGTVDASGIFLEADYSVGSAPASQQVSWQVAKYENASHPKQTPATVCDFNGAGQIEAIWIAVESNAANAGVMEGNVEVYIDGQTYPAFRSSGMEDFIGSGWYNPNNIVGGYPAGQSGLSDQAGTNFTYYRFFSDNPIFFSSHLKVVVWAGQPGEADASWASSTIGFSAFCSYWLNSRTLASYTAPDFTATPVFDDQITVSGALDSAVWGTNGTTATAIPAGTGTSIAIPYDVASSDVRIWRKSVGTLPANYWAESRVRVTQSSAAAYLQFFVRGNNTDPWNGDRCAVSLRMVTSTGFWSITAWDNFNNPFANVISNGRDLTNQWLKLALKVVGTKLTAYWNPDDPLLPWMPIGSWTTATTGSQIGFSETACAVEYDYLTVRPLTTIS
jgi:hypothetical protein